MTRAVANSSNGYDYVTFIQGGKARGALFSASAPASPVSTDSWSTNTPATAVPLGGYGFFLDGTDVWFRDNKVLTNAVKPIANSANNIDYVTYIKNGKATGAAFASSSPSAPTSTASWSTNTPATAVPIGGYGFYLDGTDVWYRDNKVLTNVTRAVANSSNGYDYVTFIQGGKARGALFSASAPASPVSTDSWSTNTPATAVPLGGYGFFLDGTDVWFRDNKVLTNAVKPIANSANNIDYVTYVQASC